MSKRSGLYPRVRVDARGSGVVSQAGGLLLVDAARASGLDVGLSEALAPCRDLQVELDAGHLALPPASLRFDIEDQAGQRLSRGASVRPSWA